MKKTKYVVVSALLAVSMLALAACGGSGSKNSSAAPAAKKEVAGKTIKLSGATVLVPNGWLAITPDASSDKTDDFTETQAVNIYKGAKDASDYEHVLVQVQCVNTETQFEDFKKFSGLDDIKDAAELKAGDLTFKTFTGKQGSYEYTAGSVVKDGHTYSFMALTKINKETLDVNSDEVIAILSSIKPTKE